MTCSTPRLMDITIETFSSAQVYTFRCYRHDVPTFLINAAPIHYYGFETIAGAQERFLYSDIRHISFTEVI
jgi:hypothetical protein